jgi:capsular polysaccharide biosynthesis protein
MAQDGTGHMELRDYLAIARRRYPVVLLVLLASIVSSILWSKTLTPIYRATTVISVTPDIIDFGTGLAIQSLLQNYAQRLKSKALVQEISTELDLPVDRLRSRIRAQSNKDDLTIKVEVDDPDPARAQLVANRLADRFVEIIRLEKAERERRDVQVSVLEYAEAPGAPHFPKTRINAAVGAILGLVVGGLLAFFLEYLDDTIKTAEDVDRYLGLPVLGSVPTITPTGTRPGRAPAAPPAAVSPR